MLSVVVLNVIYAECLKCALYAQCHYAECCYAECRGALQSAIFLRVMVSERQCTRLGCKYLRGKDALAFLFPEL